MKKCPECGTSIDRMVKVDDFYQCPECDQQYVFDPTKVKEEDLDLETSDDYSGGKTSPEKQEEEQEKDKTEAKQEALEMMKKTLDENEEDSESPECKHCGESMDEAPEHIDSDWLCHNDGCEGSFQEEELEEDEEDENLLWTGANA